MADFSQIVSRNIDRDDVRLIDILEIDEKTLGRLDIVCMAYYSDINYMPLLLDWNGITDVSEMKIGDKIQIPEMRDILQQLNKEDVINDILQHDFDDDTFIDIPGIIDNKSIQSKSNKNISNNNQNKTTANTKLEIENKKAEYNPQTGEITYY